MVDTINNSVQATSGFGKIVDDIVGFFSSNYWNVLLFVIVFLAGLALIKLMLKLIKAALTKSSTDGIMQHFVLTVSKCVLGVVLVLALFKVAGIEITGLVTAISAILLAVGVALQSYISNIASGIVIACSKMYRKGDYIIVDNEEGQIEQINILFTTLITCDNKKVIIPNSKITSESVVNVFANNVRRIDFTFSVSYESDIELVKKIVMDTLETDPRIKKEPAPFCGLYKLSSSSLDFLGTGFCKTEDYWKVYYYITEQVYNEFKRNGISVPYQQTEVRIRNDEVKYPVIEQDPKIRGAQVASIEETQKDFSARSATK